MKTPRKQLAQIIADETLGGVFDGEHATSLAAYLLAEGRTGELRSLLRDVQRLWADRGTVEVLAWSAHTLSDEARRDIEAEVRRLYPHAEHIIVTLKLDPSVIGGLRLEFTDQRLDLSVAGELQKFKALAVQGKDYR